jgi:hypothetical protein
MYNNLFSLFLFFTVYLESKSKATTPTPFHISPPLLPFPPTKTESSISAQTPN